MIPSGTGTHGVPSLAVAAILLTSCLLPLPLGAQEHAVHGHQDDHTHTRALHFTHPLIAESVSPDTKLRLDYARHDFEGESEGELELEGEYALHRALSIEAGVHYHPELRQFGRTHIVLKFANHAFAEQGLLLGSGLEVALPTGARGEAHGGHDHGETGEEHNRAEPEGDIYEVAPFLNAGFLAGRWELVGWTLFEIPTNQSLQENVGTELRYHVAALYHAALRIKALIELHGQSALSGPETGRAAVNLAPGLRISPLPDGDLALGTAVSFPLSDDHEFDTRILVSAFYHF